MLSSAKPYFGTNTLLFNIKEFVYAATGLFSHGPPGISGQKILLIFLSQMLQKL